MRLILQFIGGASLILGPQAAAAELRAVIPAEREEHSPVLTPPEFHVEYTELDGPVFASTAGKTLYYWPQATMRNGVTGDVKNKSACGYEKRTHTAGLMSPFPPGLELPELVTRRSCAEVWTPVLASATAKPKGDFTIIARDDGTKQWAYAEHALYTSYLDKVPGDVMAASTQRGGGDGPAARRVTTAPTLLPPGFKVSSTELGRHLLTSGNFSVYASDRDGPNKSNCDAACTRTWAPVVAAIAAQPVGEWTTFERSPGIWQWAFRKKPLYTYVLDRETRSLDGSDIPGWHNVYTQKAPAPPKEFTYQDTVAGIVLADAQGRTIYTYNCADDSLDQLACDQLDSPPVYRLAICGGGDAKRCRQRWPYVEARADAKSISRSWQVVTIDPDTGHIAPSDQAGALRVWAYTGQPIYTFSGDKDVGDIAGHKDGEFGGSRNGFRAFFIREAFSR